MRNITTNLVTLLLIVACGSTQASPIFVDQDDSCDDCDAVLVVPEADTDSLGRVTGSDGSKWKEGADGVYRSEDGTECRWSASLEEWSCEK